MRLWFQIGAGRVRRLFGVGSFSVHWYQGLAFGIRPWGGGVDFGPLAFTWGRDADVPPAQNEGQKTHSRLVALRAEALHRIERGDYCQRHGCAASAEQLATAALSGHPLPDPQPDCSVCANNAANVVYFSQIGDPERFS